MFVEEPDYFGRIHYGATTDGDNRIRVEVFNLFNAFENSVCGRIWFYISEDSIFYFVWTCFQLFNDAVYEAYCDGRKVPVTDVEIEAAAKYLKANPGLFGPSACFIDPNRFEEIARSVLQAARNAVGKDME